MGASSRAVSFAAAGVLAAGCHTLLDIDTIEFGDPIAAGPSGTGAASQGGTAGSPAEGGTAGSGGAGCDCPAGMSCDPAGSCKLDDGEPCLAGRQCLSGHCTDGVCCDAICDGACASCDQGGLVGICSAAEAGTGESSCAPYLCDGAMACPESCAMDSGCVDGFRCSGGACQPVSCRALFEVDPTTVTGSHTIDPDGEGGLAPLSVHCDMDSDAGGWTLVARFANQDSDAWMLDSGDWWYDRLTEAGAPTSRSENADMISAAFWLVIGDELRISRTDNATDAHLLLTNAGCLAGQTLRAKVTGYGDFRNGAVWGDDSVEGTCPAALGNNYAATKGFERADCTGTIGAPSSISFWADFGSGDGAVLMIGGGGDACGRADHGIGLTEANAGSFVASGNAELDFGDDATAGSQGYALNLWIR